MAESSVISVGKNSILSCVARSRTTLRHFIGEVVATSRSVARLRDYAFGFDSTTNHFIRRPEIRTHILRFDNTLLVNVIPPDVVLAYIAYTLKGRTLVVTDNRDFSLEINEFGANR